MLLPLLAGCHHHPKQARHAPPTLRAPAAPPATVAERLPSSIPVEPRTPGQTSTPGLTTAADLAFVQSHKPVFSETGTASWYGPPYNRRRGANGQVFDQDALTAAHRTLPMNSLIRVTNLRNGKSAIMHVTDRGPFVPGRVLDLSMASAKETGVYLPGTAMVRIDVFAVPAPIQTGGRWCVQIGAFKNGGAAEKLRDHLSREYQSANVIEFTGPTGHWVRIRPLHDEKQQATEIAATLKPTEGEAYLVRLD